MCAEPDDGIVTPRAMGHDGGAGSMGSASTTTLSALFPGKMGRVMLTRVAIRIRRPDLLKLTAERALEPELLATLREAVVEIQRG